MYGGWGKSLMKSLKESARTGGRIWRAAATGIVDPDGFNRKFE
jgi:hypothetical protein